jgi:hypothetical protein
MTCPHQINVAAYLLDALEQPEIDRMREHLPECSDCQAEYDKFRGPTIMLDALTPNDVEDIVAPAEVAEHLHDVLITGATRGQRRTWHRPLGLTAAAVLLVAGIATGVAAITQSPPTSSSTTVYTSDPHTHVYASATLTSRGSGTQISLRLGGLTWAQQGRLVVSSADGRRDTADTWVATYQGTVNIGCTTAIPAGQIRHLDIVTTAGTLLVSLPPPTGQR